MTLFLFFFGLAAAVLDETLFDPLTLPPAGGLRVTVVLGAALAAPDLAAGAARRKEGSQWVLKER